MNCTAYWDTYNHPNIEVDDTVVAVLYALRAGQSGSIILSNSQRPGLYGKIHVHGSSGASVGAETDSGSLPFIFGVTEKMDPPFNDYLDGAGRGRASGELDP